MSENQRHQRRILKVEEVGDHWRKKTFPRIRLKGQWLKEAGFFPNNLVEINNPEPGLLVISLPGREKGERSIDLN